MMIDLTAGDIAHVIGGRLDGAPPDLRVPGPAVADSRAAVPGSLFIAVRGDTVDGADYAAAAVAAGAVLVIAERDLPGLPTIVVADARRALGALARHALATWRAAREVRVITVTGSAGKTTTKDLLAMLVSASGSPDPGQRPEIVAPRGSFNTEIGLPLTVLSGTAATSTFVLELGADHEGDIRYLSHLVRPDVAIILMVGTAHLGLFGSQDAIAATKAEVLDEMPTGGVAILNADDERVAAMGDRARANGLRVVTFGRGAADVRALDISIDRAGRASFTLALRAGDYPVSFPRPLRSVRRRDEALELHVSLRLVGEHHVTNALAAAAAALIDGVAPDVVAARLSNAEPASPHRMAVTDRPDGVTIIDDSYNASPESVRAALRTLAVMAGRDRRSVAVLGEMRELGIAAREAHDAIGRIAVRLNVGLLVVVGQEAYHIYQGAAQEGSWGEEAVFVPDAAAARHVLDEALRPGDVVLVKSAQYALGGTGLWPLADALVAGEVGARR
jgi:UDP-N-acetylmuramoyl-tripeptide--D-alanyl-D-alanine ligase